MADRWIPQEDKLLKEIYPGNPKAVILERMAKPWRTICRRALRLGLHRDQKFVNEDRAKHISPRSDSWKPEELALLREIYEHNGKEFIMAKFEPYGRSWQVIALNARKLNLQRDPEIIKTEMIEGGKTIPIRDDFWSEFEDDLIKKIYVNERKKDIITKFPNRTWHAIRERSIKLGLKRNEAMVIKDIEESNKKTIREKYGVDYIFQAEIIKRKIAESRG